LYDIALSVAACARSGTRADVAWMLSPTVSDEALVLTPGGGRIGRLAGGAFDGLLTDLAARHLSAGRLVNHSVTEVESLICQLPVGSSVQFLLVPAEQFPSQTWPLLLDHTPVVIVTKLSADVVTGVRVDVAGAESNRSNVSVESEVITTVLAPTPRMIIAGVGPFADALAAQATLLNWKVVVEPRPEAVAGLAATLSAVDAIVVMGHDVEKSSGCLMAALASEAGYVGALGSHSMQQSRADWLAYRDVVDLSRVHGPAGLDIGASSPQEVAVAIAAEAIAAI
jgi:xanthine dehydrogenase accessory factor|tara:strand:+ start:206 stop:1054 length:849 start_codon:yes stop_codon:yes gene_type:complete